MDCEPNTQAGVQDFATQFAGRTCAWIWRRFAPPLNVRVVGWACNEFQQWYVVCEHDQDGRSFGGFWRMTARPTSGRTLGLYSPCNLTLVAVPAPDPGRYPHRCPACGRPAYIGFASVECSGGCGA